MKKGSHMTQEQRTRISAAKKGKGRVPFSKEHRKKLSISLQGNKNMLGKKHSQETIEKMRQVKLGKKRSWATKEKISSSRLGRYAGNNHPNWKGGRNKRSNGYVEIFSPHHPFTNKRKYVYEHRLVMEAHLGRVLLPSEVVHHINNIKNDNRIENLMLFSSGIDHLWYHRTIKKHNAKITSE